VDAPGGGEGDLTGTADVYRLKRMVTCRAREMCAHYRFDAFCAANRWPLPENAFMRLVVICIGRLKQGPERELTERYRERFDDIGRKLGFRGLEIQEIPESRARDAATRMAEEAAAISQAIPAKSALVALDERGDNIDSAAFARQLGRWRDEQAPNTIFAIGGADGLSPELRRKAKLVVAFGSATWPHQMVRVMLLEQVYRAATILAGHPYHRA
jgi:23S rRNA (pseudouridine1915-N3)-methyltransferase